MQRVEVERLDQREASGARDRCVSPFGVHDMTGNVDEWVNSEEHKGKSQWAGLKGGAWGHVRMFTPWRMNVGPASARLLARHGISATVETASGWRKQLATRAAIVPSSGR